MLKSAVFLTVMILLGCSSAAQMQEAATPAEGNHPPTTRGVWLTKNEMLESREALLARLDRLRDAGFNAVYVVTQLRGYVMYPDSAVLPQWPEMAAHDGDILGWLIPAIHERGMRAEAWTEYGFYAYWTPDATQDTSRGAVLDRRPGLTAVSSDGRHHLHNNAWGDFYSLCPSNPESHALLIDLYLEMQERFAFDGLHLDRIRYPDASYCHCDYCKRAFEAETGLTLAVFPQDSEDARQLDAWRKARTRRFVGTLAERFRTRYPDRRITAAVMPPYLIDEKGQDWPTWIERGYLDAAMPMLYLPDIAESVAWIHQRLGSDAPIFYGIDAGAGVDIVKQQLRGLQLADAPGFTLWEAGKVDPMLPDLKEELSLRPAAREVSR